MQNFLKPTLVSLLSLFLMACQAPSSENFQLSDASNKIINTDECMTNKIVIETTLGDIKAEIYPDLVPETAKNFCFHVEQGNYNDVPFHRIIKDFMIQTGDFENQNGTGGYSYKGPGTTIDEEFHEDLRHEYGALSMAKTMFPSTTGSQFFIVQAKEGTPWLDDQHSVFGKVTEGMDVVESLAAVETGAQDAPLQEIKIKSIKFE